jgi:hypothetical protein
VTEIRGDNDAQSNSGSKLLDRPLKVLTLRQIRQIDEALANLGPYAEVKLIKNKGKLRFIQMTESEQLS